MAVNVKEITSFVKALTWTKLLQVFVLLCVIIFFGALYQFKSYIYESANLTAYRGVEQVVAIELTSETKLKINETANKFQQTIAGIQVVNVNFKNNTRTTAYFSITDPALQQAHQDYQQSALGGNPLFNDDEINNQRVVSLVNGEFICTPFKHSVAAQIFPRAINSVATICSVSIPPHYGKFSGYLNIYLKNKPDRTEVDMIRQIAIDLSSIIYTSDILHEVDDTKPVRPRGGK